MLGAAPLAAILMFGLLRATPVPRVTIDADGPAIGRRGKISVRVTERSRGISRVKIEIQQGEMIEVLHDELFAVEAPWKVWWKGEPEFTYEAAIGKDAIAALQGGEVIARVLAYGQGSWTHDPEIKKDELKLPVKLAPPKLVPTSKNVFVEQGGCEAVTYEVDESSVRDGVYAREWFFPGHPLPGGKPNQRFALFGVPHDVETAATVKLIAEDALGNRAEALNFITRFTPRLITTDRIMLDDKYLAKVTSEILTHTPSLVDPNASLIEKFKVINSVLRRRNNEFLTELGEKSRPAFLWKNSFEKMPVAAVKGAFADRRTYIYNGEQVDTQDHLGFDLASVARTPIPAANSGVVVFASYLGIFGNAVVIDHGFGLMTLYAHLSDTAVHKGEEVERGVTIGRTGATGLAAGDHLHFTMMLDGMPVTPVEWWDQRWIEDRLRSKLGAALP